MRNVFDATRPDPALERLEVGTISLDRSAILGSGGMVFLHQGSNRHFDQYWSDEWEACANGWAEITAARHARLAPQVQMLSLFVPNPASCLPDLHPSADVAGPTPVFDSLRRLLAVDDGVLFCNALFEASSPPHRAASSAWRLTDSHWSEFGALLTANEILRRIRVAELPTRVVEVEERRYGDLSDRFGTPALVESVVRTIACDIPDPVLMVDTHDGSLDGGISGRRVEWSNPGAPIGARLVIVGNSYCGVGTSNCHLTHWLARAFVHTTFLHAAYMPDDVLEAYRPDVILFQGLERFLVQVPTDGVSAAVIEATR